MSASVSPVSRTPVEPSPPGASLAEATGPAAVETGAGWRAAHAGGRGRVAYAGYGLGGLVAWTVVLALASMLPVETPRLGLFLVFAGWVLGWLSATLARRLAATP